jgi:hypothetical protein
LMKVKTQVQIWIVFSINYSISIIYL